MSDLIPFIGIGIFIGFVGWKITSENNNKALIINILISCFGAIEGGNIAGTLGFTIPDDFFIASLGFSLIGATVVILIVYFFKRNN